MIKRVNTKERLTIKSFSEGEDGLCFVCQFAGGKRKLVTFDNFTNFRIIDESFGENILYNKEFQSEEWIYSVTESDFIDWTNKQTDDIYKGTFQHFIILGSTSVAEIITFSPPTISSL